jgi:hypothetical protein
MSENITQYINLGIAGVALYLMYNLAQNTLEKIASSLDMNTSAINQLKAVVQTLCDQNGKTTG